MRLNKEDPGLPIGVLLFIVFVWICYSEKLPFGPGFYIAAIALCVMLYIRNCSTLMRSGIFKKISIIGILIFSIAVYYLLSNTPLRFYLVDLSSHNTCEEFKKAPLKVQTKYVMDYECLTQKLLDIILIFELEEGVQESFYNKIKTCVGSEKIGEFYRMAVEEMAWDIGKKVDIETQLEKWISLLNPFDEETKDTIMRGYDKRIKEMLPLFDEMTKTKILEEYNKIKKAKGYYLPRNYSYE